MTVAENLSTGQNAERPGGNRGELKLYQSAPGGCAKRLCNPSLATCLGRGKRGVP